MSKTPPYRRTTENLAEIGFIFTKTAKILLQIGKISRQLNQRSTLTLLCLLMLIGDIKCRSEPVNETHKQAIEKIKTEMDCPKNFQCLEPEHKPNCELKDMGMDLYVRCCEKQPSDCKFHRHFGKFNRCKCPVAIYQAKNMESKDDLIDFALEQ